MGAFKKVFTTLALSVFLGTSALAQNPFAKQFDINEVLKEEMNKDEDFEGLEIDASYLDGNVTLNGYVDNLWQKQRLIEISQAVTGVRSVVDKLEVTGMCLESEDLGKDAALALFRNDYVNIFNLKVVTDDYGRVQITGRVDSPQEKEAAQDVVEGVSGVNYVLNDIKVDLGKKRSDSEAQKDLEFALYDNVMIDDRIIEPEVKSKVATLKGNVGSEREIMVVKELAEGIEGVEKVRVTELTIVPRFDRTIVFKIIPMETNYSDAAVARAVDQANYYDTRVFSYNIDVKANDGIVTLGGVAKNEKSKQAALENAKNTIGVKEVIDNIQVDQFAPTEELLGE